ncbi:MULTISPECIES: acyl-CoA thioesterase [Paenibacillus]|uniref:acyl-CoA thioesterase n=1 Tax=Paenibacillus TaxID=44249 RepID=UPI0022B88CFC|nr:acyl-CoA thioesterase [Paenibacillus caseinilyticus]MCZ8519367.1 acyl-CoA thioesterase [Paenibacillus caseinilyticus]
MKFTSIVSGCWEVWDWVQRYARESRCYKTSGIFPTDVNNHNTLFGGKLMAYIDDIASIAAIKHCRCNVVTASTDSVDFLSPVRPTDSVCLEAYVTWTGRSSMEVFVKVSTEDLLSGSRKIAATSFLTFVALNQEGRPVSVPQVMPESEEERKLFETAEARAEMRRLRREQSRSFAGVLTTTFPWET